MTKFDNNELERRVDEVLFYVWDPIGISDEPAARWEYKSYVSRVLQLVSENNDPQSISTHLADIVITRMGLPPNDEKCKYTAEILLRHKNAIKDGLA